MFYNSLRRVRGLLAVTPEPLLYCSNAVMENVHLVWLNWFPYLVLVEGFVVILKDCMVFLSPLLDDIRMSIPTVSFIVQLYPEILCLQNGWL